jgi:CHAD domain-containing protein
LAYHLEQNEPVGPGLWRVFREELQSGAGLLARGGDDDAIHDARRSLKKARSVAKLLRPLLGARYERENSRLRMAGRKLSDLRDDAAMIETFDDLKAKNPRAIRAAVFRRVREGLALRKEGANAKLVFPRPGRAWRLPADDFSALAPGLEATWRRGRKALAEVRLDPRAENFHALRRRVKEHRFQMRLLEGMGKDKDYVARLERLDGCLGDQHNLVVLGARLAEDPARYGGEANVEQVLALVHRRRRELEAQSIPQALEVYGDKARRLVDALRERWDTWQAPEGEPPIPSK